MNTPLESSIEAVRITDRDEIERIRRRYREVYGHEMPPTREEREDMNTPLESSLDLEWITDPDEIERFRRDYRKTYGEDPPPTPEEREAQAARDQHTA